MQKIWCDKWIVKFGERNFITKHSPGEEHEQGDVALRLGGNRFCGPRLLAWEQH